MQNLFKLAPFSRANLIKNDLFAQIKAAWQSKRLIQIIASSIRYSYFFLSGLGLFFSLCSLVLYYSPTAKIYLMQHFIAKLENELESNKNTSSQAILSNYLRLNSQEVSSIAHMQNITVIHEETPSIATLVEHISTSKVSLDAQNTKTLNNKQEKFLVGQYLARRYRVAYDIIIDLVNTTYLISQEVKLDPLLLLSIIAIESRFNPYAESGMGAQGLMQVMGKVHKDKFDYFGGTHAAFHPLYNIKVGAWVLKEYIARGGSLEAGLQKYAGATGTNGKGYIAKVIAERERLRKIANGIHVSIYEPQTPKKIAPDKKGAQRLTASTS